MSRAQFLRRAPTEALPASNHGLIARERDSDVMPPLGPVHWPGAVIQNRGVTLPASACPLGVAKPIVDQKNPRTSERRTRTSSEFIILHTTEHGSAREESVIRQIARAGSANYVVGTDGTVYRTLHQEQMAYHAGRSMWRGVDGLNAHSIGVEVVGQSDRPLTREQIIALRDLIAQLQSRYPQISDDEVLPHAMVAYVRKNPWHSMARGRKEDALQFGDPVIRRCVGLNSMPRFDPDVVAGRLNEGDGKIYGLFFGEDRQGSAHQLVESATQRLIGPGSSAWTIARENYDHPDTRYIYPNGTVVHGDRVADWGAIPAGTRVLLPGENEEGERVAIPTRHVSFRSKPTHGETAWALAGAEYRASTTIYFLPDGRVFRGDEILNQERDGHSLVDRLPSGTRVITDYQDAGR
ncbi:MAG: peptidoglycan recognition family protein, partial [Myxococcota bacterium]